MAQEVTDQNTGIARYKQVMAEHLIPQSKKCIIVVVAVCKDKLVPGIKKCSSCVAHELAKIHKRENWFKRFGTTFIDNAAGLGMAMLAGKIVQNSVEVEQFSNLWGLLASRPVVSETTFEVLSFAAEFIIALLVFTLTEHYLGEYRKRKSELDLTDEVT